MAYRSDRPSRPTVRHAQPEVFRQRPVHGAAKSAHSVTINGDRGRPSVYDAQLDSTALQGWVLQHAACALQGPHSPTRGARAVRSAAGADTSHCRDQPRACDVRVERTVQSRVRHLKACAGSVHPGLLRDIQGDTIALRAAGAAINHCLG